VSYYLGNTNLPEKFIAPAVWTGDQNKDQKDAVKRYIHVVNSAENVYLKKSI
jgi:hypothetical protein